MNNFIGKHTFQQKKWRKDGCTRAYTNFVVWPSPYACPFHQSFFVRRDQKLAPDFTRKRRVVMKSSQRSCQPSTVLYFQLTPLKNSTLTVCTHYIKWYLLINIKTHLNWAALLINAKKAINLHQKIPTHQRGQAPVSSRLHCKLPSIPKLSFSVNPCCEF